jgi:Cu/Ag efflux pump CusA
LGIVVVGGILLSLVLTLFVIPAMYTYISGKHEAEKIDKEEIENITT